jgi:hypothetical protein
VGRRRRSGSLRCYLVRCHNNIVAKSTGPIIPAAFVLDVVAAPLLPRRAAAGITLVLVLDLDLSVGRSEA